MCFRFDNLDRVKNSVSVSILRRIGNLVVINAILGYDSHAWLILFIAIKYILEDQIASSSSSYVCLRYLGSNINNLIVIIVLSHISPNYLQSVASSEFVCLKYLGSTINNLTVIKAHYFQLFRVSYVYSSLRQT